MVVNEQAIQLAKEIYNNTGHGIKHSLKLAKAILKDERKMDSAKVYDKCNTRFKQ